ncbi:hypothetical protein SAMN04515695_1569 [Pseudovibrio sp. Tun.PSC04-5.I4]|nr:hypothetical protein SAMN04515695_1569 [Pseudovibrio sp. Tun.PSC04-5.I4]
MTLVFPRIAALLLTYYSPLAVGEDYQSMDWEVSLKSDPIAIFPT